MAQTRPPRRLQQRLPLTKGRLLCHKARVSLPLLRGRRERELARGSLEAIVWIYAIPEFLTTANKGHWPGTSSKVLTPRLSNSKPDPATKSRTVCEIKTSPNAATNVNA